LNNQRRIALTREGAICAAHVSRYSIECFSATGVKLHAMARDVSWFPPFDQYIAAEYDEKRVETAVGFFGIAVDQQMRVWIAMVVADANWRARRPEDRPGPGESGPLSTSWISDQQKFVDTIYEVLDLRTGVVIASQRDDGVAGRFVEGGRMIRMRETAAGTVVADVLVPRVVSRR
jgi:hypothetical protein